MSLELNEDQENAVKAILGGHNCFVTGPAGTGKSTVIQVAVQQLKAAGKNVILCAPTGIAATNIGGITIHRAFGLKPGRYFDIDKNTFISKTTPYFRDNDVVIIDEISMCRVDIFDAVCDRLRKTCEIANITIQLVVVGDFAQLAPVIQQKSAEQKLIDRFYGYRLSNYYAFEGRYWNGCNFMIFCLSKVMRQSDADYIQALHQLRNNDKRCIEYFNHKCSSGTDPSAVSICNTNNKVDRINKKKLDHIAGEEYILEPIFDIMPEGTDENSLRSEYKIDTKKVKLGCRILITANDIPMHADGKMQYYNGSMGTLTAYRTVPQNRENDKLEIDLGGTTVSLGRKVYTIFEYRKNPSDSGESDNMFQKTTICTYRQFPILLGYAITIHRSQGMTYEHANVDPECKVTGQLYVALSRVKSIDGLFLLGQIEEDYIKNDELVCQFYSRLEERKRGRPSRYYGKKTIQKPIPVELCDLSNQISDFLDPMMNGLIDQYARKELKAYINTIPAEIKDKEVKEEKNIKSSRSSVSSKGRPKLYPNGAKRIRLIDSVWEIVDSLITILYKDNTLSKDTISTYVDEIKKWMDSFSKERQICVQRSNSLKSYVGVNIKSE